MENNDLRDLLYQSLDQPLRAEEAEQLALALQQNSELAQERAEVLRLRAALAEVRPTADAGFAQRVLARLPRKQSVEAKIQRLWPAVAAACLLTFTIGLGQIVVQDGHLDATTLVGLDNDLLPEEALVLDY